MDSLRFVRLLFIKTIGGAVISLRIIWIWYSLMKDGDLRLRDAMMFYGLFNAILCTKRPATGKDAIIGRERFRESRSISIGLVGKSI